MNHSPVAGRNTLSSLVPSPSKSAAIGTSPGRPDWKNVALARAKAWEALPMNQPPMDG